MNFDWDEAKRQANLAKHGIDFADAIYVFTGPHFAAKDVRADYGEARFISIGYVGAALLVVVYKRSRRRKTDHFRATRRKKRP